MPSKAMKNWRKFTSSAPMKGIIKGAHSLGKETKKGFNELGGQIKLGAKKAGEGIKKEVIGQIGLGARKAGAFIAKNPEVLAAAPILLKKGGYLKKNRMAMLHKGELVVPAKTTKAIKKLIAKKR